MVDLFKPEDVIADVFAGVGPFAIPAGKKGCGVFANDLNPSSHEYLVKNIADNRVCTTYFSLSPGFMCLYSRSTHLSDHLVKMAKTSFAR